MLKNPDKKIVLEDGTVVYVDPFAGEGYDLPADLVLVTHEQNAAHAADGYARASGKVGVCIATSGPGATNLVTGIATAFMDSIPIVAITGQVDTALLGKDAFQETDILDVTMPITKHNYKVKDARQLVPVAIEQQRGLVDALQHGDAARPPDRRPDGLFLRPAERPQHPAALQLKARQGGK